MMRNALFALCLLAALPAVATAQQVTVFAAASLTEAMQDVSAVWEKRGNPPLRLSFASSSTLARQIENGAPANVFASADAQWMNYLAKSNAIVIETRVDLLSNDLVLIVPKARARAIALDPELDIAALLGSDGRLATGDPAHVPAGIYAQQALTRLGLWARLEPRLARTEDVRGALMLVGRGEAPAGIVYSTDAAADPGVAVAGTFPPGLHDPITYPFAVVRSFDTPQARSLMTFLAGAEAKAIFARRGFRVR